MNGAAQPRAVGRLDRWSAARVVVVTVMLTGTLPLMVHSQPQHNAAQDGLPRFESSTVLRASAAEPGMFFTYRAARFTASNVTLSGLIRAAFGVPEAAIRGGPSWVRAERFDVTGIGDVGPSPAPFVVQPTGPSRLQLMVQSLLAEQFKLVIHSERRRETAFALERDAGDRLGGWLRPSNADCGTLAGSAVGSPPPRSDRACQLSRSAGSIRIAGRPLTQFVSALSAVLERPVVDHTGLTGNFDIELEWTSSGIEMSATEQDRVRAAILDRLGLVLTPQDQTIDVTVIDHAERPVGG